MKRTSPLRTPPPRRSILPLLGILVVAACARPVPPLRVGANVWPGYEPLFLARERGDLKGAPLQLIEFSSSAEVVRAYRNGLIDVAAVTADEALLATLGREGERIVLVCDISRGADVLLARPGIASLRELRGKRIGVETTALGAYVLARALDRAGLSPKDVRVMPLPIPAHEAALTSGAVDALVTFEPHRTRLLAAGAHPLFDSAEIPGEVVDLLLTHRQLAPAHEAALQTLVAGWFRALDQLRADPEVAAARMARREGVSPRELLASLRGLEQPDRDANLKLLRPRGGGLEPALRRLAAVMLQSRLVDRPVDPPELDDAFVRGSRR